jgi:hypothetical protein
MSRRALARLPLLLLGVFAATAPVAAGAGETPPTAPGFVAIASAQDARLTYSVLGFAAVEDVVDGGGTVAQAQLDGGGNSRSFAALPYPGDVVVSGPGLFAFATGQQLPGGYPFFVAAETPLRPEAKLDGPGGRYSLLAQATPRRSAGEGRVLLGDGESGGRTHGQAVTEVTGDGTVRSVASSVTEGLNLGGGQLRIGVVRSSSVTTLAPGADRQASTSSLTVEGMTVGGVPVTVGPDGLSVAGSPLGGGAGIEAVERALRQVGIEVQLVEAEAQNGGERARSLEVRLLATPPFPGFPPQQVVISLGGASTAINVGESLPGMLPEVPPVTAAEPAPAAAAGPPAALKETPAPAANVSSALGNRPVAPTIRGPGGSFVAGPAPDTGSTTPAPMATASPVAAPTGAPSPLRQVTLARGLRHPITALYLPLVVGTAVAFTGVLLWFTRGGTRA